MELLYSLLNRNPDELRPVILILGCVFFFMALITLIWWLVTFDSQSSVFQSVPDSIDPDQGNPPEKWQSRTGTPEKGGEWEFSPEDARIPTKKEIAARAEELANWRDENGIGGSQEDDWILAERELYMTACGLSPLPDRALSYNNIEDHSFEGLDQEVADELRRLGFQSAASIAEMSDADNSRTTHWLNARGLKSDLDKLRNINLPSQYLSGQLEEEQAALKEEPELNAQGSRCLNSGSARVSAGELNEIVSLEFSGEDVVIRDPFGIVYQSPPLEQDNLQDIKGVGPVLEGKLHEFGVYKFKQIANWPDAAIDEFQEQLSFPDRIRRDNWIGQCESFNLK